MRLLDESVVRPDEIDSLGHLNARYYMERVRRANERVTSELGLTPEALEAMGAVLTRVDTYTRYQREQRLGARLSVLGGLIGAGPEGLRLFAEVRNAASGDLAAGMIVEFALEQKATRARLPIPAEVLARALAALVQLPDYGAPRSLTLDPLRRDVTFAQIFARVGDRGDGANGGLSERTIPAEGCDEYGYLREGAELVVAMEPPGRGPGQSFGPPVTVTREGLRYGWALMELRSVNFARPRAGDVLRAIGALIGLEGKIRRSRRWTFEAASGRLMAIDDTAAILLDIDKRRAMDIPPELREELADRQGAEFA